MTTQTQAERIARREAAVARRAARLREEFGAVVARDQTIRDAIPLGQPILIGHHSEGRHRADLARLHRNAHRLAELHAEIRDTEAATASTAILDGDADALDLLRAKITDAEAKHAAIRARPHERWETANSSANLRRMRERLAYLEAAKARPTTERMAGDVRIVEDTEAMRLRLYFPAKPAPEMIARLKHDGWRWAPSEGAWQQNLHNRSRWLVAQLFGAAP